MVGEAALRACIADPKIRQVTTVGRRAPAIVHPKLSNLVVPAVGELSAIEGNLAPFDACLWCLGVSSVGMSKEQYEETTYELTLRAARLLKARNPLMTFVYVSGAGTGTDRRAHWARVKGRVEEELTAMFPRAYMLRPGHIQPRDGIRPRNGWVRTYYRTTSLLYPVFSKAFATDTTVLGRAMVALLEDGGASHAVESKEINARGASNRSMPSP
ncbi:MAG: Rossmann-fold NAD(P)-binding domain-containing protein [Thermoplasmatota archaeon]